MDYKSIKSEVLDIDDSSNRVVAYIAAFGNKDRNGDIIRKGAFSKTIQERGPQGTNEIWMLANHNENIQIGKPTELMEDEYGLKSTIKLADTTAGRDAKALYKDGFINYHSIGFITVKKERKSSVRELTEIKLFEGSYVLWPANLGAKTQSVDLKSLDITSMNDFDNILQKMYYFCRNSDATDELLSSMEKNLKEMQLVYNEIKKNILPDDSTKPLDDGLLNRLQSFNDKFN